MPCSGGLELISWAKLPTSWNKILIQQIGAEAKWSDCFWACPGTCSGQPCLQGKTSPCHLTWPSAWGDSLTGYSLPPLSSLFIRLSHTQHCTGQVCVPGWRLWAAPNRFQLVLVGSGTGAAQWGKNTRAQPWSQNVRQHEGGLVAVIQRGCAVSSFGDVQHCIDWQKVINKIQNSLTRAFFASNTVLSCHKLSSKSTTCCLGTSLTRERHSAHPVAPQECWLLDFKNQQPSSIQMCSWAWTFSQQHEKILYWGGTGKRVGRRKGNEEETKHLSPLPCLWERCSQACTDT